MSIRTEVQVRDLQQAIEAQTANLEALASRLEERLGALEKMLAELTRARPQRAKE